MSNGIPYLDTTGPGFDLETFAYIRRSFPLLPDPVGTVKFNVQGHPLPDPAQSVDMFTLKQVIDPSNPNPFVATRWHGVNVKQVHKPDHLSANEVAIVE